MSHVVYAAGGLSRNYKVIEIDTKLHLHKPKVINVSVIVSKTAV
jgi:hypothetical protein